ncbi:K02A2.6-like [Cordylochernes scorpioides]|uniref:K02A2.6-like n=1 Tax=Cordylochernes scorpioides TaxID=51811 RepID=A0ABY6LUE3_9ARAC|nr:K02A2.6-like [Cordylochernes scorpioides]
MSCIFKGVCKAMGVGAVDTTAWRPQSNGAVERLNRSVIESLRRCTAGNNWDTTLPMVAFAIRTTVHASTGFTPAKLVFGHELRLPQPFQEEERLILPVEPEEPQETAILRNPLGIVNGVIDDNVGGLEIRRSTRVKKPTGWRPPDLQAWIFGGSGLEDDALSILASAKLRIYRYFVQVGLGEAVEDPLIAWSRTLQRRGLLLLAPL